MALRLYNTLSRKKEKFVPIKKDAVGMYTCGPTVYWFAHAGMFKTYIFADVLKRVLNYNGYKVNQVINVTDVGHLTSDADTGEDKIEAASKKEGKRADEVAKFYFDAFLKDFKELNLIEPWKFVWATEHIVEQIELIKSLGEKGFTYKTGDGVYFDTSKDENYGRLSRKNVEGLEEGKRTKMREKKNKTDFALWKFSGGEKRLQEWDSPWGVGYPGWHIECSAMATKYLGKNFDIHTGGIDHIPIHHENEIAQSECGYGIKNWVNYWMHGDFLIFEGGKMSKSSGKIKTISELKREGISALDYKYFTYSAHYRRPLAWSEEAVQNAAISLRRLKKIVSKIENNEKVCGSYLKLFEERINDDLDIPGAIAILWNLVRDKGARGRAKYKSSERNLPKIEVIKKMDRIFGLKLLENDDVKAPIEIKKIAEERIKLREEKNWKKADLLRGKLEKIGWKIEDTENGYVLEKINQGGNHGVD